MMLLVLNLVAGGVGAVLRYLLDTYLVSRRGWSSLRSLFLINTLGSALLGLCLGTALELELSSLASGIPIDGVGEPSPPSLFSDFTTLSSLVMVAVFLFSGFTTFSTVMVEVVRTSSVLKAIGALALALIGAVLAFVTVYYAVGIIAGSVTLF